MNCEHLRTVLDEQSKRDDHLYGVTCKDCGEQWDKTFPESITGYHSYVMAPLSPKISWRSK